MDGFKKSIAVESFDLDNATRLVSTIQSLTPSMEIRNDLEVYAGEYANTVLNGIMEAGKTHIETQLVEEVLQEAEIKARAEQELAKLCTIKNEKEKVFCVFEFLTSEIDRLVYYLVLQDGEPDVLVHLSLNDKKCDQAILSVFAKFLEKKKRKVQVFFEYPRHEFMSSNIDIFTYILAQHVVGYKFTPMQALKILTYNEVPFITELLPGSGDGEEEMMGGLDDAIDFDQEGNGENEGSKEYRVGSDENYAVDDQGFDDFDDFDDGPAQPTKKPEPKKTEAKKASAPKLAVKESKMKYDDFDDDFDEMEPAAKDNQEDNFDDNFDDILDDF